MKTEKAPCKISLQFFAEGGEGGDGGAAGEGSVNQQGAAKSVDNDDVFMAEMEQKYGITNGVASAQAREYVMSRGSDARSEEADDHAGDNSNVDNGAAAAGTVQKSAEDEFDELVKSEKYKGIYGKRVAVAVKERFKNQNDARAEADKYKGALSLLASKYGKSEEDTEGIIAAMQADDELLEKEAFDKGKTVDALRADKKSEAEKRAAEKELSELRDKLAAKEAEDDLRINMQRWVKEAEETKKLYGAFDFRAELQNKDFRGFLNGGMSVTDAYKHAHIDEIIAGSIKAVETRAYQDAARAVQTNRQRPVEGAASAQRAPAFNRIDVSNMSDEDFNEIENRIARGERVTVEHLRR